MNRTARRRCTALLTASFAGLLGASGCDLTDLITVHTAIAYTQDGTALVSEATDGIYVASPPDADPERISGGGNGCEGSGMYSLGCVRLSPDSVQMALLKDPILQADETTTWTLKTCDIGRGDRNAKAVAQGVLEATYAPQSQTLLWAEKQKADTFDLMTLDSTSGTPIAFLKDLMRPETDTGPLLDSVVITATGVGYAKWGVFGLSVWFKPFDGREERELGRLSLGCMGSALKSCFALSHDETTMAWQEPDSGILQIYRSDADQRIPLGVGSAFRFSRAGKLLLRFSSQSLFIHRPDTGAIVRQLDLASAGQLSLDGETIAYFTVASSGLGTGFFTFGSAWREGSDTVTDLFFPPSDPQLAASPAGTAAIPFAFTGDDQFAIIAAADQSADNGATPSGASSASDPSEPPILSENDSPEGLPTDALYAVNIQTGETRKLDAPQCKRCCQVLAAGKFIVCTPPKTFQDGIQAYSMTILDPETGRRTDVTDKVLSWSVTGDGTAILYSEYSQGETTPRLWAFGPTLRPFPLGNAFRFALSPDGQHVAKVNGTGQISVTHLP